MNDQVPLLEREPTRVIGNASSLVMAAGVALIPVLPPPWGVVAAGGAALISVLLTELNRSRVTSEKTIANATSIDDLKASVKGLDEMNKRIDQAGKPR